MLRAGLPVAAAEGSRLPFFLEVKAAVDERGDLAKDLSTFTAHLAAVKEMLAGAVPGSLVLVDEIAADTDPREGRRSRRRSWSRWWSAARRCSSRRTSTS